MATVVGIVEESRVDELTKKLIDRGWGETYSVVEREYTGDERLLAAPGLYTADGLPHNTGFVVEPGAMVDTPAATDGILLENIDERIDEYGLSEEEKNYYAHRIADGGTFVAVEVDDDYVDEAWSYFAAVDAQQMESEA